MQIGNICGTKNNDMFAVLLAGGSGTRLWPVSRQLLPKQFLHLTGEKSLLENTIDRILPLVHSENILIIANRLHAYGAGYNILKPYQIIVEPVARGTAPAIALAAAYALRLGCDPVLVLMPADHVILDNEGFLAVISRAADEARRGRIVCLGITPDRPETGYGYIESGESENGAPAPVKRFVEKPDHVRAEQYLRAGNYLWNSGIYVTKASVILDEIKKYLPEIPPVIDEISARCFTDHNMNDAALSELFPKMPNISIDYGVMEKSDRASVIACDIKWSDIGSWAYFHEISEKDSAKNAFYGDVVAEDCAGSLIYASDRLVTAIGLRDIAVLETADAVLVCPLSRSQEVRVITDKLKARHGHQLTEHVTVERPWGSYTVLEERPNYKVKRLKINPGQRISLQIHRHRAEHWTVISGVGSVTKNEKVHLLNTNESIDIPKGTKHSLENPGKIPVQVIEVQSGEYLGEDDIIRFEDIYGR